jgi:hypothetical protein
VHSLERLPRPWAEAGSLIVCSAEGKGAPLRGPEPAPAVKRRHPTGGPQAGRKQIAGVGTVYPGAPFVRTPDEVCESWFEAPPADPSSARPKPPCNRWRASRGREVKQRSPPAWDEVFGGMAQQGQARTPQGRHPIVLG